jgi:hypothetical protein
MCLGEGLAAVGGKFGRPAWLVLVAFVLAAPAGFAILHLSSPRSHAGHSHGDLRRDLQMGVHPVWPRS